ncbi:TonB family protein [Leptospira levettii]|uniref:Energy transducer TonB n=2 Tax=Leptospira levettii TaxID=2023178 RepID=A0A5F2D8H8_9LEPT|nr:TonB family protein [Leptospira levettii]MCW7465513.1 energy transducer TonB [Leptospira levettii]MCW7510252.1 energy transducer TonB [Leptospira levettii]MCW7514004.1 energy transducer TonB [Leptospira levettii]PJZ39151.1 TonB-dependent receptor [Leptospira levettii]PKA02350.1 TonB-dependent receptor [Leptospira levettii]
MAYTDNENGDCILSNKVFHELGMHLLFDGPKYKAITLSIGVHVFILLSYLAMEYRSDIDSSHIKLKEGGNFSSFQLHFSTGLGESKESISPNQSQNDGTKTVEDEISEFQNCLSYPSLALEQKLEDHCVYRLSVKEDGSLEKIAVVTACRYAVFDQQVRRQLSDWKFQYTKGKEFVLPIRFRLDVRD